MGLADKRMTASSTPNTMPITMAMMVSSIVVRTPLRVLVLKRLSPTTLHLIAGLVTAQLMSWATSTTMMTAATHRPG